MFKSHTFRGFLICLAVTLGVLALFAIGALDSLEWKSVDLRFHWRGQRTVNKDIAVVVVDEASIKKLGRWPWPREIQGHVIDKLSGAGAKAIAFDVLFTEPDKQNPKGDESFAAAAARAGNVVSAFFYDDDMSDAPNAKNPTYPFPALAKESHLGFVNLIPDHDGIVRHAQLYSVTGEDAFPSLDVATLGVSRNKSFQDLLPSLPVVVSKDPLIAKSKMFINFAEPTAESYPEYSIIDLLNGKIPAEKLKGKIILVGGTAAGLFDVKAIPYTELFAGVQIHANIIDNLISGNQLQSMPGEFTALLVLALGLLLSIVLPKLSSWGKLASTLGFVVVGLIASMWFFTARNAIVPMVPPFLTALGCYAGITFYRLLVEEREKRKIKGSFRQYLSPKIIDIITKDPSKLRLGGEEREVSVFFLDIAGFTTMSEALKPTQLVEVMNNCLTEFSRVILKHDGLINKYIGDCIMAFWNAPADQNGHSAMACLAALDCIKVLPEINRRFQEKGLPRIDCRIGINTGTVVVGNMGSDERFDYTVLGDPVNLASRLEGANKSYQTHIMISDTTFELAKDSIEARDLDLIRVKGKKEPRKVFEVLCRKGEMSEEMTEGRKRYHHALSLYRQKSFEECIEAFQAVFDYLPNDHVTRVYLERARAFVNRPPPPTWDGVYEMITK